MAAIVAAVVYALSKVVWFKVEDPFHHPYVGPASELQTTVSGAKRK